MIAFRTGVVVPILATPFLAAALFVCASGCQSPPTPLGMGVETHGMAKLMEKNPVDVAVAPVNSVAGKEVPSKDLRECFQAALVTRRYSPLALAFVDRNVVDAAYEPGASNEQAVLTIDVERWDKSLWRTHNALTVRIHVRMIDAKSGEELWSGRVDQRYDFGAALDNLPTEIAKVRHACERISMEMMERLPARDPLIAR